MILDFNSAFWIFLAVCSGLFLCLRYILHLKLSSIYRWGKKYQNDSFTSFILKICYFIFSLFVFYQLWASSNYLYVIKNENFYEKKIVLFESVFKMQNGTQIKLNSDFTTMIRNDSKSEIVYEAVEYISEFSIGYANSFHFKPRGFKYTINPFSSYDCSRIGVEYFFKDSPPEKKKDDSNLFSSKNSKDINLYGWIRTKEQEKKDEDLDEII